MVNPPQQPPDESKFQRARGFLQSLKFALAGLMHAVRTQRNFRVHLVMGTLVLIAASALQIPRIEWVLLIIVMGMVLAAELINTIVEALVDLASPEYHELARIAKDVAAGAVLIVALTAAVVGVLILGPPLFRVFSAWR